MVSSPCRRDARHDIRLDQSEQRHRRCCPRADMVGERRETERQPFGGKAERSPPTANVRLEALSPAPMPAGKVSPTSAERADGTNCGRVRCAIGKYAIHMHDRLLSTPCPPLLHEARASAISTRKHEVSTSYLATIRARCASQHGYSCFRVEIARAPRGAFVSLYFVTLARFPTLLNGRGFPWGRFSDSRFLLVLAASTAGTSIISGASEQVVAAIAGGLSRRQAVDRFGVSAASAIRWQQRVTQHGTPEPQQQGGDRRSGICQPRLSRIIPRSDPLRRSTVCSTARPRPGAGGAMSCFSIMGHAWWRRLGCCMRRPPRSTPFIHPARSSLRPARTGEMRH